MSSIEVISREQHADKKWRRATGYQFASKDSYCPVFMAELPKLILNLPIAFVHQDSHMLPVAIQSLQPNTNYMVSAQGEWLGSYIPAMYRVYPFLLAKNDDGNEILCIRDKVNVVTDTETGEDFFGEDDEPSMAIQEVLKFLSNIAQNRDKTFLACEVIEKHQLLAPWRIRINLEGRPQELEGLFRIDEDALQLLSGEALLELKDSGALKIIYSQLLSMQNIQYLASMLEREVGKQKLGKELNMSLSDDAGNISFDSL